MHNFFHHFKGKDFFLEESSVLLKKSCLYLWWSCLLCLMKCWILLHLSCPSSLDKLILFAWGLWILIFCTLYLVLKWSFFCSHKACREIRVHKTEMLKAAVWKPCNWQTVYLWLCDYLGVGFGFVFLQGAKELKVQFSNSLALITLAR